MALVLLILPRCCRLKIVCPSRLLATDVRPILAVAEQRYDKNVCLQGWVWAWIVAHPSRLEGASPVPPGHSLLTIRYQLKTAVVFAVDQNRTS